MKLTMEDLYLWCKIVGLEGYNLHPYEVKHSCDIPHMHKDVLSLSSLKSMVVVILGQPFCQ